jgi:anti-sigma factor RsiW
MRTDERLHAYVDGELDAAAALELEREMAQNPGLRASAERLRELSAAVRKNADYHRAPARFRKTTSERPRWLMLAPAFALVLALGVGIGVLIERPRELAAPGAELAASPELVASHVRATLAGKLIDVASSDQHTVKPWLSARLPFSPPVADFSADGYPLEGARLDYLDGERVAVLVYKRRQHVIDVYVSPSRETSALTAATRDGFNVERFAANGMRYALVSDLSRNELDDFATLLRR